MKRKLMMIIICLFTCTTTILAQENSGFWSCLIQGASVKLNVLPPATYLAGNRTTAFTIDGGVEFAPWCHWSFDINAQWNPFRRSDMRKRTYGDYEHDKARMFTLKGTARYWLCDRYDGWFLGTGLMYTRYNARNLQFGLMDFYGLEDDTRYQGDFYGVPIEVGYDILLSTHWNLELSAGIAIGYFKGHTYNIQQYSQRIGSLHQWNVIPSKLAVSFKYIF